MTLREILNGVENNGYQKGPERAPWETTPISIDQAISDIQKLIPSEKEIQMQIQVNRPLYLPEWERFKKDTAKAIVDDMKEVLK